MADYSELPSIIGKMKRAAIDCWMADSAFYPNWGNDMLYSKWGWALNFYNRCDENGEGGGTGNGVNHSVAEEFEQIRQAVDAVVDPWTDLPDGQDCETPRINTNSAAALLGTSGAAANVQNSGEIATSNNTIHEIVINNMSGAFRAPFIDKYYTQFSKVTSGLGDAAVILETNYMAQQSMWPAARADIVTLCENAQNAWAQKAARAAAANGTAVFTVVAAVAGVVSSVLTAGAGTVATVAILGSIAATANSAMSVIKAQAEVAGESYGEILGSFREAVGELNGVLAEQENTLNTMLTSATSTISGDLASFNLDAFSLGEYPAADGVVNMDESDATIVSTNMGRIETALGSASTTLGAAPGTNPTPRDATIGRGASGTHTAANELFSLIVQSLTLTKAEYEIGHELFNATVDDFFETDAAVGDVIAQLIADEALQTEV